MSIQQSVNQLLGTSTIAAGLYAHQPNVAQRRADIREAESVEASTTAKAGQAQKLEKSGKFISDSAKNLPDEVLRAGVRVNEDIQNLYADVRSGYERLAELRPGRAMEYIGAGARSKVRQQSAIGRIDNLQSQLEQRQADREAQRTTRAAILEGIRPTPPKPREVIK